MPSSKQVPDEQAFILPEVVAPSPGATVELDGEDSKPAEEPPLEEPPAKKFKIDPNEDEGSGVKYYSHPTLNEAPPLPDASRGPEVEETVTPKKECPDDDPIVKQPKDGIREVINTEVSNEEQLLPEVPPLPDAPIEADEEGDEDSTFKTTPKTSRSEADEGKEDDTNDEASLDPTTSIILPFEEFAEDAEKKLNFANGRIYQRKRGVENVHDGQLMVRLKKKRFVILDYGYVPNQQDLEYAESNPHVSIPEGAGVKKCNNRKCSKIGVPVMLYDSDPNEVPSLYLRSGLCFGCQKKWNEEKRQTYTRKTPMKSKKERQKFFKRKLNEVDPDIHTLIEYEKARQRASIVLIASENFASRSVMSALGSVLCNKCSGGYPGGRQNGGNNVIDNIELLCRRRALDLFSLNEEEWGVNVQSLSLSSANFQVYTALLNPHDRILSLGRPDGGHLSHGYQTSTQKVSMVSRYFETMAYHLKAETGLIDYDEMERTAFSFHPKLIVAGASTYSRLIDYERIRKIADKVGACVLADISQIAGLMAAEIIPSCFPWADVVTTTTQISLRGPSDALIFYRKGLRGITKSNEPIMYDLEDKINFAVFPGLQGSPHIHTIGASAVALKEATSQEFLDYQNQVVKNCTRLIMELREMVYDFVGGGSDNNLIVVNVKLSCGIDGARVERIMELACIPAEKNPVPGDISELTPGGIRMGTYAMTSRGLIENDFAKVAEFFNRAVTIAVNLSQEDHGEDFKRFQDICAVGPSVDPDLAQLRKEVAAFASSFPTVGHDVNGMEFRDLYDGEFVQIVKNEKVNAAVTDEKAEK